MEKAPLVVACVACGIAAHACCGQEKYEKIAEEKVSIEEEETIEESQGIELTAEGKIETTDRIVEPTGPRVGGPAPASPQVDGAELEKEIGKKGILALLMEEGQVDSLDDFFDDRDDGSNGIVGLAGIEETGEGTPEVKLDEDHAIENDEVDVPRVKPGNPVIKGSLTKEVVRRVMRMNVGDLVDCWEKGVQKKPSLEGSVSVQFIITPTGEVQTAKVAASTLGDEKVESCFVGAVKDWSFPAPEGGGVVIVTYPFALVPPG